MGTKHTENDYDGESSLSIDTISVPKRLSYTSGVEVTIVPLLANTDLYLLNPNKIYLVLSVQLLHNLRKPKVYILDENLMME